MTFAQNVENGFLRLTTEAKAHRVMMTGSSTGTLASLATTNQTSLIAAINELEAAIESLTAGGSATDLDALTDVILTAVATGHILQYNGSNFVNVLGTSVYATAAQGVLAGTAVQPARSISTTGALSGGGDLSANRTLSVASATTAVVGVTRLGTTAEATTGTAADIAVTPAGLKTVADTKVPTSRTISTTAPLTGGGDLTANRTLAVSAGTETAAGVLELATSAETVTGTDNARATHAAGVKAAIDARFTALLGGVPATTLDTIVEIATAIEDNDTALGVLETQIAGKQASDATLSNFAALNTAADQIPYTTGVDQFAMTGFTAQGRAIVGGASYAAIRTTLDVWSKGEIGAVDTDFVALIEAALV